MAKKKTKLGFPVQQPCCEQWEIACLRGDDEGRPLIFTPSSHSDNSYSSMLLHIGDPGVLKNIIYCPWCGAPKFPLDQHYFRHKESVLHGGIAQLFQAIETLQAAMASVNDLAVAITHAMQQAEIPNLITASGLTQQIEDGYRITQVDIEPPAMTEAKSEGCKTIKASVTLNILCVKEDDHD